MRKLIRDKLPELVLAKEGRTMPTYIEEHQGTYVQLLKEKLMEEAKEVAEASPESIVEELADVLEVFATLCKAINAQSTVFEAREKKFEERGGFDKKIVLIS